MSTLTRLALVASVLLAACGAPPFVATPSPPAPGTGQLDGRRFLSTKVTTAGAERPLVAGTRIEVAFHERATVSVTAGCNTMAGTYRLDGAVLQVLDPGMTAMGCDPERHTQDDWIFQFLGAKPTMTLAGNDLVLTGGDTIIQLVDRKVAQPDQPLVGPVWRLDSIIAGDTVSSVPAGVQATIQFAADGSATIHPGCNQGNARYAVNGDRIAFNEIVTTKMACGPPVGDVENGVLQVLRSNDLTYAIEAKSLTIGGGGIGLVFRAS
jgi:heat shock protein HslJ